MKNRNEFKKFAQAYRMIMEDINDMTSINPVQPTKISSIIAQPSLKNYWRTWPSLVYDCIINAYQKNLQFFDELVNSNYPANIVEIKDALTVFPNLSEMFSEFSDDYSVYMNEVDNAPSKKEGMAILQQFLDNYNIQLTALDLFLVELEYHCDRESDSSWSEVFEEALNDGNKYINQEALDKLKELGIPLNSEEFDTTVWNVINFIKNAAVNAGISLFYN